MTKIKKILLILVLSFFLFSLGNQVHASDHAKDSTSQSTNNAYADPTGGLGSSSTSATSSMVSTARYDWMDLSKFIYVDPNSSTFFGSTTDQKKIGDYKENDNTHYEVKGDSIKEAQKNVSDAIQGMTMMSYKALKIMAGHGAYGLDLTIALSKASCNPTKLMGDITYFADFIGKTEGTNDDSMVGLNSTYSYYKCYDLIYRTAAGGKLVNDPNSFFPVYESNASLKDMNFVAGMQTTSSWGMLEKTVNAYKSHFSVPQSKNGVSYLFNTTKSEAIRSNTIKAFATGACYELMPKGTTNKCATSIYGDCKKASNIFFVFGITCEKLNPLFTDQSSSAADIQGTESRAEKDRIKVEFQVPFGDVKNGITLPEYINAIYKYLLSFGLVLSGILLAIGGFQYVAGKPGEGKTMIVNSITGMVLLSSVYLILQTINPATLDLPEIGISEVDRDAAGAATMLNQTEISVPKHWYPLKNADDPIGFGIPAPSQTTLDKLKTDKMVQEVWNSHYYTLFQAGSETKQGIYKYPITDKNYKIILWTNTSAWCATSMEGSTIFMVGTKVIPVNVSSVRCSRPSGTVSVKYATDSKNKNGSWDTSMDKTISKDNTKGNVVNCSLPTPTLKAGGETPKCSWWHSHPTSLWQTFSAKSSKRMFGGAGRSGGTLMPLRSIAVLSNQKSVLQKYIKDYGILHGSKSFPNDGNLLVYIPDAKGKQLKHPSGDMITHDGYFWVSDTGSLSKSKTTVRTRPDGSKAKVGSTQQIDMFSGTLRQNIMDGSHLHEAYVISCKTEPGKSICDKFRKQQMSGYPGIEKK